MSIALLVMFVVVFGLVTGAGLVGFMLGRRNPPLLSAPMKDQGVVGQAERIGLLEDELQRVKDQADFTERLLAERSGARSGAEGDGDVAD
jgi:hypothetical protein